MKQPDIPPDEPARLAALCALGVLDTPAEERFDRITRMARRHFDVDVALVSLVDSGRQWFKSRQGLDATETGRDISFCGHAILGDGIFLVPDALADARFADNPLVTGAPHIRFYAGAPLRAPHGHYVGTLCIIDSRPREMSSGDLEMLRDLADGVEGQLEHASLLQTEAALAAKSRLLRDTFENMGQGISVMDAELRMVGWNRRFLEMLDFPESLLREGSRFEDVIRFNARRGEYGPGDPETQVNERVRLALRFEPHCFERVRPGGMVLEIRGLPLDGGGLVTTYTDVTARRHGEEELRQFKTSLDLINDGVFMFRPDTLKFFYVNRGATVQTGYSFDELRHKTARELAPQFDEAGFRATMQPLVSGETESVTFETTCRRKDGQLIPMETFLQYVAPSNEPPRLVAITRDVTERKKVERMKAEFVATVSHELRTPLTSIRGALGLLAGKHADALPEKARRLLEMANRNSERLTLLINDLLDLEKIESGGLEFEFKALDLAALARQALAANEGFAHQHGVHLRLTDIPQHAPVQGDENRLLQVFGNLLSNAIKYSPPDGEVAVAVVRREGRYRVRVQDRGRGIPAEFRLRMFQRFAQADSSDTRERGGTGLGLSVTKAILDRHHGSIDFVSEVGLGTEFFFELPALEQTLASEHHDTGCPLLLVCEDNSDVARVLVDLLARDGLASDIAATAAGAKSLLGQRRYQALVLDLSLPDQDGLALIRELRAQESTRDLPIVVVSGRANEGRAAWDGDALAVVDWLQKPVDQARLRQVVRAALVSYARPRILHVEDNLDVIQVTRALVDREAEYAFATTLAEARRRLASEAFELVLLDLVLPDGSGLDLLAELQGTVPVVIFSGHEPDRTLTEQVAAALVKTRASNEQLLEAIRRAILLQRTPQHENETAPAVR